MSTLPSYSDASSARQIPALRVTGGELFDQFRQCGFDYAAIRIARTQQAGPDKKELKIDNTSLDSEGRPSRRNAATIPANAVLLGGTCPRFPPPQPAGGLRSASWWWKRPDAPAR